MNTITDDHLARLRADRLRDHDLRFDDGRESGVDWATTTGNFRQVRSIATFARTKNWVSINVEDFGGIFDDGREVEALDGSDRWSQGFVAGVCEVFDTVMASDGKG